MEMVRPEAPEDRDAIRGVLLAAFEGHDGPELWAHPSNQHPNERAHAIAADALAGFLLREGLLATPTGAGP